MGAPSATSARPSPDGSVADLEPTADALFGLAITRDAQERCGALIQSGPTWLAASEGTEALARLLRRRGTTRPP